VGAPPDGGRVMQPDGCGLLGVGGLAGGQKLTHLAVAARVRRKVATIRAKAHAPQRAAWGA
jgi:hypothetical protein